MTNARTAKTTREKAAELRAEAQRQQARRRTVQVTAVVAAVIVLVVGVVVGVRLLADQRNQAVAASTPANLTDGGFVVGNASATVTIELYEDFQCPACRQFETANATQLAAWAQDGTAKLVYRPVAILDRYSTTNYSTRSLNAAAAVMATSPSAFPAFHDLLYANQPAENSAGLTDAQLADLAAQAGADRAAVAAALAAKTYEPWTVTTTDAFSQKGYTGTPTVVVNGTAVNDWSAAGLKAAVEAAVKAAG